MSNKRDESNARNWLLFVSSILAKKERFGSFSAPLIQAHLKIIIYFTYEQKT